MRKAAIVASNLRQAGDRIETLLDELRSSPDPNARAKAEEIVRLLMEFYGGALERIVELCAKDERAEALADAFAGEPLVASILSLHGLHPIPVEERVRAAVDKVRPFLGPSAVGVEVLGVDDQGVVSLHVGPGCSVQNAVEQAIFDAVPEVTRVAVGTPAPQPAPTLLQIQPRPPSSAAARTR
jgi:Fe-S cluster biogenesis protein NfuA